MKKAPLVLVRGQSLIEILIAVFIGILLFVAAASIIAPVLKANSEVARNQTASSLAKQLMEHTVAFAGSDWHAIDGSDVIIEDPMGNRASSNLVPGSSYHLTTTTSPFVLKSGEESLSVGTTTYMRYFTVENVYRTFPGGEIVSQGAIGAELDPSTKKITVFYSYAGSAVKNFSRYVARTRNNVVTQTDWSGGDGLSLTTVSTIGAKFYEAVRIEYSSSVGSIILAGVGVPPPPSMYVLTVSAAGVVAPDSAPIQVFPQGDGTAPPEFTRTYSPGTTVTLTALDEFLGLETTYTFQEWQKNGVKVAPPSSSVSVVMDGAMTMTVVYGALF